MSQIARAIEFVEYGSDPRFRKIKFKPLFNKMVDGKAGWNELVAPHERLFMYSIRLQMVNNFAVSECEGSEGKALAVERAKEQMIEAVFGEFRPYFRRIEQAIYEYDMDEAGKILR